MNTVPEKKRLLLVCRKAPYGDSLARAALDVALAAAAFEQRLDVLFMGDGVWQLLPNQQAAAIQEKSLEATLASFPLYDIEHCYVCDASLQTRQLDIEALAGKLVGLDQSALAEFIDAHDQVLSF